jgi:hypothetical protein
MQPLKPTQNGLAEVDQKWSVSLRLAPAVTVNGSNALNMAVRPAFGRYRKPTLDVLG